MTSELKNGWNHMRSAPETGNGDWLPNCAKYGQALIVRLSDGRTVYEAYKRHGVWAEQRWAKGHTITHVFLDAEAIAWRHLPKDPV